MEFMFPVPETVDAVRSEVLDPELGKVQGSTHLEVVTNTVESLWVSYSSGQAGKEWANILTGVMNWLPDEARVATTQWKAGRIMFGT